MCKSDTLLVLYIWTKMYILTKALTSSAPSVLCCTTVPMRLPLLWLTKMFWQICPPAYLPNLRTSPHMFKYFSLAGPYAPLKFSGPSFDMTQFLCLLFLFGSAFGSVGADMCGFVLKFSSYECVKVIRFWCCTF